MKGHSIELPFSVKSKECLWDKLCEVEGPWAIEEDFKPHLSLAVIRESIDDGQVEKLREIVRSFAEEVKSVSIQLSSIGIFPGKRPIMTLMPAHHPGLLEAHHRVSDQLAEASISPITYYQKHQWSPHVTIMMGRPRKEVSAAVEELSRVRWPGEYVLDEIELIEFHPAVKLEKLKLVDSI